MSIPTTIAVPRVLLLASSQRTGGVKADGLPLACNTSIFKPLTPATTYGPLFPGEVEYTVCPTANPHPDAEPAAAGRIIGVPTPDVPEVPDVPDVPEVPEAPEAPNPIIPVY